MNRFLTYSLLCFLMSCGTAFQLGNSFSSEKVEKTIENQHFWTEKEHIYRANISAYGHSFNGIFVAKQVDENHQRVALTSDFGNTLLDFSFIDKKLKINYIQDELNRKIIINTLANDFQKLLKPVFICNEKFTDGTSTVWKCKDLKDDIYLFTNEKQHVFKQVNTKKSKKYTTFAFALDEENNIKNIDIQHHTIDIKITLNQM